MGAEEVKKRGRGYREGREGERVGEGKRGERDK